MGLARVPHPTLLSGSTASTTRCRRNVRTGASSVTCEAGFDYEAPARRLSAQVLRSVGGRSHRPDIPWVVGVRAGALGNLSCHCDPSKYDRLRRKLMRTEKESAEPACQSRVLRAEDKTPARLRTR